MKFKKNWKRFWTLDRHHAEGFTLVELIVVIAILAILGGVAVPAYSGYVKKANMAADQQLVSEVANALLLQYYSDPDAATGGWVLLSTSDADGDGVGTKAMNAAFGADWKSSASLKYDWSGTSNLHSDLSEETAKAIVNSSFVTGSSVDQLLGDVSDLTQTAYNFLTEKVSDPALLYSGMAGNFASSPEEFNDLCKEFGITTTTDASGKTVFGEDVNNTQIANLMVLAAAKNITDVTGGVEGAAPSTASQLVLQYATFTAVANSNAASDETKAAYAAMNAAFKNASSVAEVQEAMSSFEESSAFTADYTKYEASGLGDGDSTAFLSIMQAVNNVSGTISAEDLKNENLYTSSDVADSFGNYISAAGAVADGRLPSVPAGSLLIYMDENGVVRPTIDELK